MTADMEIGATVSCEPALGDRLHPCPLPRSSIIAVNRVKRQLRLPFETRLQPHPG